jgi:uncharacterized protein YhjY with autotransporter beta-barrel domain
VFVGAVTSTGFATLSTIALGGADAGDFAITSSSCITGSPSLEHGGALCTIEIAFNPVTAGVKNAALTVSSPVITRTIPLTGFGDDGNPPDPTDDAQIKGLMRAQIDASKRFSSAQLQNYQRRLEALRSAYADGSGSAQADSSEAIANFLVQLASSDSSDLGGVGGVDSNVSKGDGYNWWVSGNVHWGTRADPDNGLNHQVRSDGISIGFDRWFNNRLAAGLGLGLGNSDTDIGDNGTESIGDATSIAAYLSYQTTGDLYLDGVFGIGSLEFDADRYDQVGDIIANSTRDGSQWFASFSVAYAAHRDSSLLLWPYARVDLSNTTLDSATESGAGALNLEYDEETYDSSRLAVGVLAEAPHATDFGWVSPHFRLELQTENEDNLDTDVSYAVPTGGQVFTISPDEADEHRVLLGVGADFHLRNGITISADYNGLFSSGDEDDQYISFGVSSSLEGNPAPSSATLPRSPSLIQVEAGFSHDDNANLANDDDNAISTNVFNLVMTTNRNIPFSENSHLKVGGRVRVQDEREHQGLDNLSLGGSGEWQYRASSGVDEPIYGVFGRAALEYFDSDLRTGARYAVGASFLKPFSNRLDLIAALEHNVREGDDEVFENDSTGIRVVLNVRTGERGTILFGIEQVEGDVVSSTSGPGSGALSAIATALVEEDAYFDEQLTAYKIDAETTILTLRYNHALGPNDSIDFGWRNIDSEATDSDADSSLTSYEADQLSVFYIMQF